MFCHQDQWSIIPFSILVPVSIPIVAKCPLFDSFFKTVIIILQPSLPSPASQFQLDSPCFNKDGILLDHINDHSDVTTGFPQVYQVIPVSIGFRFSWITVSVTVLSKQCVAATTMCSVAWLKGNAPDLKTRDNMQKIGLMTCPRWNSSELVHEHVLEDSTFTSLSPSKCVVFATDFPLNPVLPCPSDCSTEKWLLIHLWVASLCHLYVCGMPPSHFRTIYDATNSWGTWW